VNRDQIRSTVVEALKSIAPDADPTSLDPRADIREALDIDSMDFLGFVTTVHRRLAVDIPERDYPKVRTLDGCVDYLESRVP
jgi:acyl carrier protein